MTSFYSRFVKDFSTIASPLNDIVMKNVEFTWEIEQEKTFNTLKEKLTNALILALPKFSKSFELECDVFNVGIGVVLLQEGHPISYLSDKIKGAILNYSTYGKELCALIRSLTNLL